ncbi:DUF4214 domain-containing protein [Pseudoduganella sp. RAF53_2]|uniref:DUF4214 domain-containing protein n=1 Tax=unclassified Pseudoduganella TaxID=2637179 RepID=UPI003F9DA931
MSLNSAHLAYLDGAYVDYSGVVFADPNAMSGTAYAATVTDYWPANFRTTLNGHLTYNYSLSSNGTASLQPTGGTITSASIDSLLLPSNRLYPVDIGNQGLQFFGNISENIYGDFSGTVTSMTAHADKFLKNGSVTGTFDISGNAESIGKGLSATAVSGVMNGYSQQYTDGSAVAVSGASIEVNSATSFDKQLLANGGNWSGDDTFNITLPAQLPTPWVIASGAGNDNVLVRGGSGGLSVDAGSGNDRISLIDDGHQITGGDGIDTVILGGARSAYTVTQSAGTYTVHANASGLNDILTNVERVQFSDATVALDIGGVGGQAYRLYQAAFNRAPDSGGLGFWIAYMDKGMSLNDAAQQFMASPEFKTLYGTNPSNADFVDKLYHNVLHRAGEADGVKFWMDYLTTGGGTQAKVLAFFGESPENQAALIGTIGNGFTYTPYTI